MKNREEKGREVEHGAVERWNGDLVKREKLKGAMQEVLTKGSSPPRKACGDAASSSSKPEVNYAELGNSQIGRSPF